MAIIIITNNNFHNQKDLSIKAQCISLDNIENMKNWNNVVKYNKSLNMSKQQYIAPANMC